jgi:hypothetical protein
MILLVALQAGCLARPHIEQGKVSGAHPKVRAAVAHILKDYEGLLSTDCSGKTRVLYLGSLEPGTLSAIIRDDLPRPAGSELPGAYIITAAADSISTADKMAIWRVLIAQDASCEIVCHVLTWVPGPDGWNCMSQPAWPGPPRPPNPSPP